MCVLSVMLSGFELASVFWAASIAFTLHQAFLLEKHEFTPNRVSQYRIYYHSLCWVRFCRAAFLSPIPASLFCFVLLCYKRTRGSIIRLLEKKKTQIETHSVPHLPHPPFSDELPLP